MAAHPRVSGENASSLPDPAHDLGSSPRERGKPVVAVVNTKGGGLIPA